MICEVLKLIGVSFEVKTVSITLKMKSIVLVCIHVMYLTFCYNGFIIF